MEKAKRVDIRLKVSGKGTLIPFGSSGQRKGPGKGSGLMPRADLTVKTKSESMIAFPAL